MKAETAWKWMPAVVLSATLVFGLWRVMVALDDPHFSVVENAYEKGAQWDEQRAAVHRSEALGWQISLTPGVAQSGGDGHCTLSILGSDGLALADVRGEVIAYHNGYPNQLYRAEIVAGAAGDYSFDLPLPLPGKWRWQFRFHHGEDLWIGEKRADVFAGATL
jgi:hypothetical protein